MPASGAGLQTRLFHSRHRRHVQDAGSEEPPPKKVHLIALPATRRVVTSGRGRAFLLKEDVPEDPCNEQLYNEADHDHGAGVEQRLAVGRQHQHGQAEIEQIICIEDA